MDADQTSEILQKAFEQAVAFHRSGKLSQARELYGLLLQHSPDNPDYLRHNGIVEYQLGRLPEAVALLERAIALQPGRPETYNDLANAQQGLRRFTDAVGNYDRALTLAPRYAEALANRSVALNELKRFDEALHDIELALSIAPDSAISHNCRGNVLHRLGRLDEARRCYEHAIVLAPEYAEAYTNLGNVLREQRLFPDALASYDRALAIAPDYALALNNRGNAYQDLRRFEEALADYNRALELMPAYGDALNNLGNVLLQMGYCEAAVAAFDQALAANPQLATASYNKATALQELGRLEEAKECYAHCLAIDPECAYALGDWLHLKMRTSDWDSLPESLARLAEGVTHAKLLSSPFPLLGLIDSPTLQQQAAIAYAEAKHPAQRTPVRFCCGNPDGKIRIGYYSADFYNHATANLIAELFEEHDRSRFELYGFGFGPRQSDSMRQRLLGSLDRFIDITEVSDGEAARISRELGIDIAVDLKGYTKDARTRIFASRAAPIQINFLGYPGTMGVDFIDYIIADKIVIPPEFRSSFSEKVVYLPNCYQVNDSKRRIADGRFSRPELGLPESRFVYCCFNNNYKILPATFESWMRILRATNNSVLWLLEDSPAATGNLRCKAESCGVDSTRLVFAKRMPIGEHLARHRLADLFLDTLPCNAHTTASDALWAGLPVLTLMGNSFAGRVASSLLEAIGLPELIMRTPAEYEASAIELAQSPARLRQAREKLEQNRLAAPLFNGKLFARNLEKAYTEMISRHRTGLPPDDLDLTTP